MKKRAVTSGSVTLITTSRHGNVVMGSTAFATGAMAQVKRLVTSSTLAISALVRIVDSIADFTIDVIK